MIKLLNNLSDLQVQVSRWKNNKFRIGLVPTMGSLHDGHLSLLETAKKHCDKVVTSIYVNPTQFSKSEDFDCYPRDFEADLEKLAISKKCDLVFKPHEMYHQNHSTQIVPSGVAISLEADARPHFFSGVSTIILKLFNQIQPDIAVFGEKDYQQLLVVKQLTRDLNLPIQIISGNTVREKDGLAMSSRNTYLSKSERKNAPNIYRVLKITRNKIQEGLDVDEAIRDGIAELESVGINEIEYFSLRDPDSLKLLYHLHKESRLLIALNIGKTRLIDNINVPVIQN